MSRKCENWLSAYNKWTIPRSEAPESFIFWTGLFCLSSALRRKVFIPKSLLGSWACAPNLYILFIARAGKARKSTTSAYAEELLDFPEICKSPELITKEALLNKLVKSNDASMCIIAPEFGEFIAKSGPAMFGFLTNMYDGKKKIDSATLLRGGEFAEKPCVNLLGATTPEWVAENMPESVIGGGFASRVIFIFEDKVRRRKLFYDDIDQELMQRLQKDLITDLQHIAENISGEVSFAPDAKEFFEDWYIKNAEGEDPNHKLSGYYERRPAHILKVATCHHVAYSDDLVLNKVDLEGAIEIVKAAEHKLPQIFQNIGRNPYTVDIYRILDYITEKGRVSRVSVRRHFMHAATPKLLDELIDGLHAAGYISLEIVGDDAFLIPRPQLKLSAQPQVSSTRS